MLAADSEVGKLAKVDATVATNLATKYGIRGFPTIKFFRNGVPSDYEGGRVSTEIASWVKRKSGPSTVRINTVPELESFQENNEVFVIGVFFSTDSPAAKVFEEVAGSDDSNVYGSSTTVEIQQKLGVTGDAIVILKKFDELRNDLVIDDKLTVESLKSFIASTTVPLIQEFSPERSKKIFSSEIKVTNLYMCICITIIILIIFECINKIWKSYTYIISNLYSHIQT